MSSFCCCATLNLPVLLYLCALASTCARVQLPTFNAGIKVIYTRVKKAASVSFTAKRLSSLFKCGGIGQTVDPLACSDVQWTHIGWNIAAIHSLFFKFWAMMYIPRGSSGPSIPWNWVTVQSCDGASTGSENYEQWGPHHESDLFPTCWELSTACNRGVGVLAAECFQSCGL